jgi:protein-tyrosine phosphatase
MDDGSKSVANSLVMLEQQASQGIDTVVATPHFYANDESVESFLNRRERSFNCLKNAVPNNSPKILLGAEVKYYSGISRLQDLKKLRIQNSNLLLLEMPMMCWSESTIRELLDISSMNGITLVLAHYERYMNLQKRDTLELLLTHGVLIQVNSTFFQFMATRRKALSMLKKGMIHFIGSDCHDLDYRPPKLQKAFNYIEKKLGKNFLSQMNAFGSRQFASIK